VLLDVTPQHSGFVLFYLFYTTLNSSEGIIRMMKSRRMRWTENVARMGVKRKAYRILVGKPEDQDVGG
jgi:hypothetical protein